MGQGSSSHGTSHVRECCVCFDENPRGVACGDEAHAAHAHFLCADCAPREVQRVLQALQEPVPLQQFRARGGRIKCVEDGCAAPYRDELLLPLLPWSTAQAYRREQADAAEAPCAGKLQSEAAATAEFLRRHYRNAVQCPRCHAGPVIPENCADLQAHHNEPTGRGGRISNACRECGFFSRNRADWVAWDGSMRGEERAGGDSMDPSALLRGAFSAISSATLLASSAATLLTAVTAAATNLPVASDRMQDLSRQQQDQLATLMNVAGIDDFVLARDLLRENNWHLQASVNAYFDGLQRNGTRSSCPWAARARQCSLMFAMLCVLALLLLLGADVRTPPSGVLAYHISAAARLVAPAFVVGEPIRLERRPGLIPGFVNGRPSTAFRASNLPDGLTIDRNTGVISGTAVAASSRRVQVSAYTPGVAGGPTTTLTLKVKDPVQMNGALSDVFDTVMAGAGTVMVGALYWLVTQND